MRYIFCYCFHLLILLVLLDPFNHKIVMQEESCTRQINVLVEQVRMMLHKVGDPLEQLELIDVLQRLGLSYHFEAELKRILEALYSNDHGGDTDTWKTKNLYATALKFRLLRQRGYSVSQGIQ